MIKAERIGLVAVRREIPALRQVLQQEGRESYGDAILYTGSIHGRLVALAEVLPGPVSGALGTQALVAKYAVTSLIGYGTAGGLDVDLSPGDLIVARRAIAHDAGVFLPQGFEPSGVVGRDAHGRIGHRRSFEADPELVALALDAARHLGVRAHEGSVVTGNQAVFASNRKRWLRRTFDALAVEMETAAVAQVAVAHRLPWVAVRVISDNADDELALDYGRLRISLGGDRPLWWQKVGRWWYLMSHPRAWGRLRRLHQGMARASVKASRLVETMLQI
jgi:adenosylhomocysteine nucleosidase